MGGLNTYYIHGKRTINFYERCIGKKQKQNKKQRQKNFCFVFVFVFIFLFLFLFWIFDILKPDRAQNSGLSRRSRRHLEHTGVVESHHHPVANHGRRLAHLLQLPLVELDQQGVALLIPVDREVLRDVTERLQHRHTSRQRGNNRDLSLGAHGERRRAASALLNGSRRYARRVALPVDHRDDADMVRVPRILNRVAVGVHFKSVHQADIAVILVILPLEETGSLGLPPLIQVRPVPNDSVPVRAVIALNRQEADWEVFPDILAESQIRHNPILESVALRGRAPRIVDLNRSSVLRRRHEVSPAVIRDGPVVLGQIAQHSVDRMLVHKGRHFRKKERK